MEKFIGSLIFLVFLVLLFYLFFQLYKFLWFVSPIFLTIALFLESKVVLAYFKNIWHQMTDNFFSGLMNALINIVGFPFVSIGLIFKAWVHKKFGQLNQQSGQNEFEDKYTPYEEVELDSKTKSKSRTNVLADGRYDDLFE
jgi:hypothetical protein